MVRKLALAVSVALGTLHLPVYALGLGELSSKSTLNQNFRGDIALLSVGDEELAAVRVRLADAESFARAGLERPFYLSLLKFEPELTDAGKAVIRVSSDFPIREPFLNFLIEVNWPNGRLLREYTVLLDPPTTTGRRPPAVTPAAKAAPAVAQPAPPPARPAVARTPSPAPAPSVTVGGGASEYGPVQANDTAWSIAKQVRPQGVSMEQMMMALLAANPEAFIDDNINRLRRGRILRVPSLAEIQQLDRAQARAAYRAQQDQWLARREERLRAAAASQTEPTSADGTPEAESDKLRIATARPEGQGEAGAGDDDASAPAPSDLRDRLLVARENAETSRQEAETLRGQVDDLQARLENMQRLLVLKDEQLAQLQDRVANAPAEEAQPTVAEAPAEPAAEPQAAPEAGEAPAGEAETIQVDTAAAVDQAIAGMTGSPVPLDPGLVGDADYQISEVAPQIDPDRIVLGLAEPDYATGSTAVGLSPETLAGAPTPPETSEGVGAADVMMAPPEDVAVVAPDTTTTMPGEQPVSPPATPPETPAAPPPIAAEPAPTSMLPPALAAQLEQNSVPIAIGGVAFLGLVGWLATRRRRQSGEGSAEPALAAAAAGAGAVSAAPATQVAAAGAAQPHADADGLDDFGDSMLNDELAPGDINALQDETGEVDPVSEADVYIAYGRYQQAEELLRQAMTRDPDRLALRHKLLEVHYATRNTAAFAALAEEMHAAGQDAADENAWARAQDMGRELAPGNPLFALAEGETPWRERSATARSEMVDEDTLSLDDLELSELNAAYEDESGTSSELDSTTEVSIQLDLDSASELNRAVEPSAPEPIALEGLDFDLSETDRPAGQRDGGDLSDSLDLDTMVAQAEQAVDRDDAVINLDSEFSAADLQAQLDELSDLSALDADGPAAFGERGGDTELGIGLVQEDLPASSQGLDEPLSLDVAFDNDELGDAVEVEPLELDVEAPGGEDEIGTKLDLARAYIEMGDQDGARGILEEVVNEGSAEQRDDARQMLAGLG